MKINIDWVDDQPELLTDVETGEIQKVHVFTTMLGISSLIYWWCQIGKNIYCLCLCIAAMNQMQTVKFIRANSLMTESEHAHQESTYYGYSNKMASYDLLVIDDFGLLNLDMNKCRN